LDILLTSLFTSPILSSVVGTGFALVAMTLLLALSVYAGLYYSVPRMLIKWLSRRAFQVL
jgi:hypothetical protein